MNRMAGGNLVDESTPAAIAKAIKHVNQTPGLRIKPGIEALWALYRAPGHTLPRQMIEKEFGAFDLHFGWFCRRVAEELGAENPDTIEREIRDEYSVDSYSGNAT